MGDAVRTPKVGIRRIPNSWNRRWSQAQLSVMECVFCI